MPVPQPKSKIDRQSQDSASSSDRSQSTRHPQNNNHLHLTPQSPGPTSAGKSPQRHQIRPRLSRAILLVQQRKQTVITLRRKLLKTTRVVAQPLVCLAVEIIVSLTPPVRRHPCEIVFAHHP